MPIYQFQILRRKVPFLGPNIKICKGQSTNDLHTFEIMVLVATFEIWHRRIRVSVTNTNSAKNKNWRKKTDFWCLYINFKFVPFLGPNIKICKGQCTNDLHTFEIWHRRIRVSVTNTNSAKNKN